MIISVSIDVNKIDKEYIAQGKKGRYLYLSLKDGIPSEYGHEFTVFQDYGKEARLAGKVSPIIGNGKFVTKDPFKPKEKGPPVPVIAGTETAIQRGIKPFRKAALTREKAMLHAIRIFQALALDHVKSSPNAAGAGAPGDTTAIALNNCPI